MVRSGRILFQQQGQACRCSARKHQCRELWRVRCHAEVFFLLKKCQDWWEAKLGMELWPQMGQNTKMQTENKILRCQCRPFPEGRSWPCSKIKRRHGESSQSLLLAVSHNQKASKAPWLSPSQIQSTFALKSEFFQKVRMGLLEPSPTTFSRAVVWLGITSLSAVSTPTLSFPPHSRFFSTYYVLGTMQSAFCMYLMKSS